MDQVFFKLLAVQLLLVSAACANTLYFQPKTELVCPDNKHTCNSDTTCCLLPDGQYGCCMYANAVCCSDNIHCCPTGSYCDVNTGSCDKNSVKIKWSKKVPAALYIPKPKVKSQPTSAEIIPPMNMDFQQPTSIPWAKKLPGLKLNSLNISSLHSPASCSVSQTLCKSNSGLSGCCPFPNAVCCDKGQQCCPSGFQCNLKSSKCEKPTEETTKEMTSLVPGHTLFALKDPSVCPDVTTVCPKDMTCCLVGNKTYACCPYSSATCCEDHEHCCPNGYNCDITSSKCVKKQVDMILVKLTKWIAGQTCPDMETTCPEGSTCCPLQGGAYGCCPYPQATCCTDDKHCCPKGYTCDLKDSRCVSGSQIQSSNQMVVCPDKSTLCPSSSTCCPLPNGGYGCCPYVKATCCTDNKHCCPNGYTCDLKDSRCVSGSQIQSSNQMVVCPDKSTLCPSSSTCCPLPNNAYGCCPYVKATCCDDYRHCCPNDYTCDLKAEKCIRNGIGSVELSILQSGILAIIKCPDDSHCPAGTTCCATKSGYQCCPIPEAVCCQDNKHCCPKNYHCDLGHRRCVMGQSSLPLFEKFLPSKTLTAVKPAKNSVKFVMCPDYSECPDRNTCCLMDTGAWGCCPFMNAVCCIDRKHCCPKTYFCDMEQSKCVSVKSSINPIFSMFYFNLKPLKKSLP